MTPLSRDEREAGLVTACYTPTMTDDLVGIAEIAKRHGTSKDTIRQWRYRHPDFPAPAAELAMGPVWEWKLVEAWLTTRGRRNGAT